MMQEKDTLGCWLALGSWRRVWDLGDTPVLFDSLGRDSLEQSGKVLGFSKDRGARVRLPQFFSIDLKYLINN